MTFNVVQKSMAKTMKFVVPIFVAMSVCLCGSATNADSSYAPVEIDYKAFLAQHDMLRDRIPNRWEVAPYTGNGNVGFLSDTWFLNMF